MEFVNGGMVMADSACSLFDELFSNFFYGMSFLKRNFNSLPSTAWQIDPFGTSKTFGYVASLFGIKDIVLGRIPFHKYVEFGEKYE